jgi:hypothetical protein
MRPVHCSIYGFKPAAPLLWKCTMPVHGEVNHEEVGLHRGDRSMEEREPVPGIMPFKGWDVEQVRIEPCRNVILPVFPEIYQCLLYEG